MSEQKIPIPAMLYNAAVGGHVTNSQQIIDENLNKEQVELNKGILEEKEYTSGSNNGMGRVVLRKNLVNGVNTLTQNMINKSNTIYIIQYDFTLGENITVPANCVLLFEGGSISGEHTITGQNTGIEAGLVKIFNTDVTLAGTWNITEAYPEWIGATNDINTDSYNAIQKCIDAFDIVVLSAMYKSNSTISIKTGDKIIGKSTYTVGIKFDDSVNIGITQKSSSTLRACILKDFQIHKDTKTSNSSGILFSSASETSIENVSVVRFTYGFDLNSFYICTISRCNFVACDYGIYFGRNGGNSTSCTIDSCYAMQCDVGYELKKLVYSTLNSCACDYCRIAYDFWHSAVNLDGCGCEAISERVLCLDTHDDGNFNHNRVKVNNFIIINCTSTVSPIKIDGLTRWYFDRNTVELNLIIVVGYSDSVTKNQYLIEYGGDTQLYLNNIVGLYDQELFNTNYDDVRAQNIYVNGIRKMVWSRLIDGHTVISGVGDRVLVYTNDSNGEYWIMAVWNGTQWKDERGFTPNSHKGRTVNRPHGKADTAAGYLAVLETTDIGFDWFDIDLNKPVYAISIDSSTGVVTWVDATGTTV